MIRKTLVAAALGGAAVGCGMHSMDMAGYQNVMSEVSSSVQNHETAVAALTTVGCATEMSRYAAEMAPMLDRMTEMSGQMGSCMVAAGSSADMRSTCESMTAELDAHVAGACAAPDVVAETREHVQKMNAMLDREAGLIGSMGSGCGH